MSKFTNGERSLVKNIVANLTIKRISEEDIIKVIFDQTDKTITGRNLEYKGADQERVIPLVQDHARR